MPKRRAQVAGTGTSCSSPSPTKPKKGHRQVGGSKHPVKALRGNLSFSSSSTGHKQSAKNGAVELSSPISAPSQSSRQNFTAEETLSITTSLDDPNDFLSSMHRKTVHGGYAHTNESRLKISVANRGNVPWNKGKNRTESAKAKIAAGVRARNREVLLRKLGQLGMTEDEWNQTSKDIKLLRERVRRAKKLNVEREVELAKQRKKTLQENKRQARLAHPPEQQQQHDAGELDATSSVIESRVRDDGDDEEDPIPSNPVPPMLSMFAPDVHWTPHPFSVAPDSSGSVSYKDICPQGGPGGLICCSICTATYSKFLSMTYRDVEEQRTSKVAEEVTQLLGFLKDSKEQLARSVRAARKKNPPLLKKRKVYR